MKRLNVPLDRLDERGVLTLKAVLRWMALGALIAFPVGTASALFLAVLNRVQSVSAAHPFLLFLPLTGLVTAYVYGRYGGAARHGMTLILDEVDAPRRPIPLRMTLLSAGGTLMTLLAGGSAGIEATGVQMACGLADTLGRKLKVTAAERPILITGAIAAGFGSIFGTPIAGAVFALEITRCGPQYGALLPSLWCAVLAERVTTQLWDVPRHAYAYTPLPPVDAFVWFKVAAAGIVLGLLARLFVNTVRAARRVAERTVKHPLARPVAGGCAVIVLTYLAGTTAYNGLGGETIDLALQGEPVPFLAPLLKILFTAVTIGFGFVGGEVTPLFFVGATAGNVLASLFGLPPAMMAKLGFIALLAGGAHAPLTGVMIGMELFGGATPLYAATACFLAYAFSGPRAIYAPSRAEAAEQSPLCMLLDAMRAARTTRGGGRYGTGTDLHAGVS